MCQLDVKATVHIPNGRIKCFVERCEDIFNPLLNVIRSAPIYVTSP